MSKRTVVLHSAHTHQFDVPDRGLVWTTGGVLEGSPFPDMLKARRLLRVSGPYLVGLTGFEPATP